MPLTQRELLVRLYDATGGGSWTRNANWLTGDPCDSTAPWYGVGCAVVTDTTLPDIGRGAEYGVTALQLAANNLRGAAPLEALGNALGHTLQLLDLSDNFLEGAIADSLFTMSRLHTLFLFGRGDSFNEGMRLQGRFPATFCTANLKYLHMQRQNLTGSIPSSIGQCSGLNQIMLSDNALTGVVPSSLTKLPLHTAYFTNNNFSCPFPCFHRYSPYASFDCASCPKPASGCYPCN